MKSKLVILSLLLAGATAATAQTKETFYSESFKDNIFVSVGVGAQGCVCLLYTSDAADEL